MILLLVAATLLLTLDPLQIVGNLIRELPMGQAFRVLSRFFPFFLFFLLMFFCSGLGAIFRLRSKSKWILIPLVLGATAVELYPYHMKPSAVRQLPITRQQRAQLDPEKFVLLITHGPYLSVHDTYQVAMNMPFVYVSYLARESDILSEYRRINFPIVYGGRPPDSQASLLNELRKLNVEYVLFENRDDLARFPVPGRLRTQWNKEALFDLEEAGILLNPE
jgi:hypothetical protein